MDKKIANRLKRHGFDEWGIHILTPIIKSLFKEYAMEIIGEDERLKKITPKNSMDRVIVQTRNSLRAEQREKLLTEDKESV